MDQISTNIYELLARQIPILLLFFFSLLPLWNLNWFPLHFVHSIHCTSFKPLYSLKNTTMISRPFLVIYQPQYAPRRNHRFNYCTFASYIGHSCIKDYCESFTDMILHRLLIMPQEVWKYIDQLDIDLSPKSCKVQCMYDMLKVVSEVQVSFGTLQSGQLYKVPFELGTGVPLPVPL